MRSIGQLININCNILIIFSKYLSSVRNVLVITLSLVILIMDVTVSYSSHIVYMGHNGTDITIATTALFIINKPITNGYILNSYL